MLDLHRNHVPGCASHCEQRREGCTCNWQGTLERGLGATSTTPGRIDADCLRDGARVLIQAIVEARLDVATLWRVVIYQAEAREDVLQRLWEPQ